MTPIYSGNLVISAREENSAREESSRKPKNAISLTRGVS